MFNVRTLLVCLFANLATPAIAVDDPPAASTQEVELGKKVNDLERQLEAKTIGAKAYAAAFDCARKRSSVERQKCYLQIVRDYPGAAVAQDAFIEVEAALESAGEKPLQSIVEKPSLPGPSFPNRYDPYDGWSLNPPSRLRPRRR